MGMLADLVAVDRARAREVLEADVPSETFGGRDVKGLMYVPLEQLALRYGAPEDEALADLVYDEGAVVFLVHPALPEAARGWRDAEIEEIADWWEQLEEHDGVPRDWLVSYLRDLRAVSGDAHARGVDVLYWMAV